MRSHRTRNTLPPACAASHPPPRRTALPFLTCSPPAPSVSRPRSMAAPTICSFCAPFTSACASVVSRRAGTPREPPPLPACLLPACLPCPPALVGASRARAHSHPLAAVCRPAESHAKAQSITDASGNAVRFCQQCRQAGAAGRHAAAALACHALHRSCMCCPGACLHITLLHLIVVPGPYPAVLQQAAASGIFPRRSPQLRHQPDQA
jgi:hypothetical protein